MTRTELSDFATALIVDVNAQNLDRRVVDKVLADRACRHEFLDLLHAGADAVAVTRFMAAVDAMNADPVRTQPADSMFTGA